MMDDEPFRMAACRPPSDSPLKLFLFSCAFLELDLCIKGGIEIYSAVFNYFSVEIQDVVEANKHAKNKPETFSTRGPHRQRRGHGCTYLVTNLQYYMYCTHHCFRLLHRSMMHNVACLGCCQYCCQEQPTCRPRWASLAMYLL
jgi:hypothetical protein